jgi:hypothetical protein
MTIPEEGHARTDSPTNISSFEIEARSKSKIGGKIGRREGVDAKKSMTHRNSLEVERASILRQAPPFARTKMIEMSPGTFFTAAGLFHGGKNPFIGISPSRNTRFIFSHYFKDRF